MKKFNILIYISLCTILPLKAQVAINSETVANGTLSVHTDNFESPSSTSGVIVPRVASLNLADPKQDGLFVFLNDPADPSPLIGNANGFYYWDAAQNTWIPFLSRRVRDIYKVSTFYTYGIRFDTDDGYYNTLNNGDRAYIFLNDLNDDAYSFCELDGNGSLIIKKTGYYFFQTGVTLRKNANPSDLRDVLGIALIK
jgi:hypothetical protein